MSTAYKGMKKKEPKRACKKRELQTSLIYQMQFSPGNYVSVPLSLSYKPQLPCTSGSVDSEEPARR